MAVTRHIFSDAWNELVASVRNWGRWGEDDEVGTLNLLTPQAVAEAARLVSDGKRFSLSIPVDGNGPQGAHGYRRNPMHLMTLDGGDSDLSTDVGDFTGPSAQELKRLFRGPMRFNDDIIIMPLQSGTQWDAIAHVYYDDLLYNGRPASTVTSLGASHCGIDAMAKIGIVGRGVLLDAARAYGLDALEPHTRLTGAELDSIASRQGVEIRPGDIVVLRTGWLSRLRDFASTDEWLVHSPGVDWTTAEWFHRHDVAAVASDTMVVEAMPSGIKGVAFAFHMIAIRDMGMPLGELWALDALAEDCAADRRYDFFLCAPPLDVTGGVGSPITPIAIK